MRSMVSTFGRHRRGHSPSDKAADDVEQHRRQEEADERHADHAGEDRRGGPVLEILPSSRIKLTNISFGAGCPAREKSP
jgi:hypothetical protein